MDTEPDVPPSDPLKPAAETQARSGGEGAAKGAGSLGKDASLAPVGSPLTPTVDAPPVEETAPLAPVEETVSAPAVEDSTAPAGTPESASRTGGQESASRAGVEGHASRAGIQESASLAGIPDSAVPVEIEESGSPAEAEVAVPPVKEKAVAAGIEETAPPAPVEETAPPLPVEETAPLVPVSPKAGRARRWLRWPIRILVVLFSLIVIAGGLILVFGPGYARGRIDEEARARGVVLAFADVELGFSAIKLSGVRVGLSGVRDFEAAAESIEVAITDWQPTALRAEKLALSMAGTEVIGELGAWKSAHPETLASPLSAEGASVEWRPMSGVAPALVLTGATVTVDAQKGSIDASNAELLGRRAGPLLLGWTSTQDGFLVEVSPKAPPLSAARVEVRSGKEGARLKLTLARTALGPLQDALGVPKGSEGIAVDGEVEMPVPSLAKPAPVDGTLRLTVKGYTPPHPRDLDGILFGDTTVVRSKFQLAADFGGAKLTGLTAEAGALSLSGSGEVTREGLDARVALKLKGSIPCTALATSAAVARLGSGLGGIAGGLAAGALKGSVGVSLTVEARASDIKGAKITQSASIGCKVMIPGLPTIILK